MQIDLLDHRVGYHQDARNQHLDRLSKDLHSLQRDLDLKGKPRNPSTSDRTGLSEVPMVCHMGSAGT